MADGTRANQVTEAITSLRSETNSLREELSRQGALMEQVLQQLHHVASNYENFTQSSGRHNAGEGSSQNLGENLKPLLEAPVGIQARTMRLDFPHFDGGEPHDWILKAQQFFAYCQTPEDQKLQIASFHMEGKALSWYCWLMESSPTESWEAFLVALRTRFGPSAYEDPVGAFTKLRQTGSVEEYQTDFEILSNKITGVSEEFRISTFLSGLRDGLRIMVTMFRPNTISAAFGLARLQEEAVGRRYQPVRNTNTNTNTNTNQHNHNNIPPYPRQAPLRLPAPNHNIPKFPAPPNLPQPNQNFQKKYPLPIKRLNASQMQERREKGLCFNCDEKYHYGHKCSKPSLYLLEGIELEEDCYDMAENSEQYDQSIQSAELLVISLNAIAGVPSPKTMRLVGYIEKHALTVLIDTSSI